MGFVTTSDALVLVGILKAEYQSAREMADIDPSWLAQAQLLERVIPTFEQSEIIVIE